MILARPEDVSAGRLEHWRIRGVHLIALSKATFTIFSLRNIARTFLRGKNDSSVDLL